MKKWKENGGGEIVGWKMNDIAKANNTICNTVDPLPHFG